MRAAIRQQPGEPSNEMHRVNNRGKPWQCGVRVPRACGRYGSAVMVGGGRMVHRTGRYRRRNANPRVVAGKKQCIGGGQAAGQNAGRQGSGGGQAGELHRTGRLQAAAGKVAGDRAGKWCAYRRWNRQQAEMVG